MNLTGREMWMVVHGMGLGATFLLAYAGGLAGLWSLRPEWVTVAGLKERSHRLSAGTWIMAIVAWLTVITGTYIVYPWYRAWYELGNPNLVGWHTFGMEWKQDVAWLAPMLATPVAYVVARYGAALAYEENIRRALIVLFTIAFLAAAVAGLFGAFLTKVFPIR
jgi:hypothetical protein